MSETKDTLLDKLASRMAKVMFSSEEKSEAKEVKLETAKLKDGTEVEIEGNDISVIVRQEGEEVEKIPAPVGEHELENGDIVVVKEEGKVAEVKSGQAEKEVEAKEDKKDDSMDLASEVENLKKEVAEIKKLMQPKEEMSKEVSSKEEVKEEPKEDAKQELSKDAKEIKVEDEKVELQEAPKKISHSPEKEVKPKFNVKLRNQGGTKSLVYNKLFS